AICGTRGWTCPNDTYYLRHDEKIYLRELGRLEMSLQSAKNDGYNKIIVMLHYPPTNDKKEPSGFTEILERYPVEKVVYGHLHGAPYHTLGLQGKHNEIEYYLTSCDYTNFELVKLK
ncbi:MAG: serine/threonine protein phosphatase, partial [Peptostreptococcales bacterium]